MSETTSPKATIFPKNPPGSARRRLDVYLAEALDLLVGIPRLPQRPDDVQPHVRHVAGHQVGLPVGDDVDLAYHCRQDAALRPPERLYPAPVTKLHATLPDVREGEEAIRAGWGCVGLPERPSLEGEVRAGAAEDPTVRPVLQNEARVRAGHKVRLQLVEGRLYVGVPLGPEDVPRLALAVRLAVLLTGRLVVGMEVDGEHVGGVEELQQDREVRPAPALPDELVRELLDEVVEGTARVGAVRHGAGRVAVVADLPRLGDDAVGDALLAESLGYQALAEGVPAHVESELYRVGLHGPSPVSSFPCRGHSTRVGALARGRYLRAR